MRLSSVSLKTITFLVTAAAFALGSCSSDSSGGGTASAPTSSAAPTTDPPTTPAPTTVAPTTAAPTTLAPTPPAPFFLRGDGIGPFDFGATYADVVAGMPLTFVSDDPYVPGGELFFAYPAGRTVCWDDGGGGIACAYFGGADPAALSLVGWSYGGGAGVGLLSTDIGATVNKLLSDIPAMPPIEGACYDYTTVSLDGVSMDLSTGSADWFGTYAADGSWVPTVPVPPTSFITYMRAGDQMVAEGVDC